MQLRARACLRRYVDLFAEEVVRGGPAFALSLVLSAVEPALRAAAELGAWQLISPVNALGRVAVVEGLHEVQDEVRCPPLVAAMQGCCDLPRHGVDLLPEPILVRACGSSFSSCMCRLVLDIQGARADSSSEPLTGRRHAWGHVAGPDINPNPKTCSTSRRARSCMRRRLCCWPSA